MLLSTGASAGFPFGKKTRLAYRFVKERKRKSGRDYGMAGGITVGEEVEKAVYRHFKVAMCPIHPGSSIDHAALHGP